MLHICLRIILAISYSWSLIAQAESSHYIVEVRALKPERAGEYYGLLLKIVLNASKKPNEIIDINFSDLHFTQSRWIAEVATGQLNEVLWTTTSKEREQILRPIRVPIFKGLLGKRIFVIRREDQAKFEKVQNKNDLSIFKAGQGEHWSDTDILEANGLSVTAGAGKQNLYKMLKANRFDYFPRGLTEIASEAEYLKEYDLMVEEHLMLSYTMPIYFFVCKENVELAERLEKGWSIILKNSEFDRYFYNHPRVKVAFEELQKYKRKVIRLDNPYLPIETPIDKPEYWLDISKYEY